MSGLPSSSNSSVLDSSNTINTNDNRAITVTRIATTNIRPDKILIKLGIQITNKTVNEALTVNSDIMNKVFNVLKAENAKENETSTSSFTISPEL